MKRLLVAALVVASCTPAFADQFVNGYIRKDGTYVQPHYRSDPNNSTWDNYSTEGNINPYNGKVGTRSQWETDTDW